MCWVDGHARIRPHIEMCERTWTLAPAGHIFVFGLCLCACAREHTRHKKGARMVSARVRRPRESEPVGNVAEFHGVVCLVTLSWRCLPVVNRQPCSCRPINWAKWRFLANRFFSWLSLTSFIILKFNTTQIFSLDNICEGFGFELLDKYYQVE